MAPGGLRTGDMEALVGLQCQQLDLLTLITSNIDEFSVSLLARIQCPLNLRVYIVRRNLFGRVPLLALLASLFLPPREH